MRRTRNRSERDCEPGPHHVVVLLFVVLALVWGFDYLANTLTADVCASLQATHDLARLQQELCW